MDALNALETIALQAFGAFVQLIVYILDFFLVLARIILTAFHLQ